MITDAEADDAQCTYVGETAKAAGTEGQQADPAGGRLAIWTVPQAVTYARLQCHSWKAGISQRTERQRLVVERLFEKAVSIRIWALLNEIIDTVFPQVSTSFCPDGDHRACFCRHAGV